MSKDDKVGKFLRKNKEQPKGADLTPMTLEGHDVLVLPKGPKGADGKDGVDGKDGKSITGPKGSKGDKGDSIIGPKGDKGDSVVGPQGDKGEDGDDGVGIQDMDINITDELIVTLDNGAKINAGLLPTGKRGKDGKVVKVIGGYNQPASGGGGDVVGPASATDNALARYDGTTGKLIQGSGITIDDSDNIGNVGKLAIGDGVEQITIAGVAVDVKLAVHSEGATDLGGVWFERHTDVAGFGAHQLMSRTRGTEASSSIVQNGDTLGRSIGLGYDGTDYAISSEIRFEVDGTPGAGDMPGRIVFLTTPDGAEVAVEVMRISKNAMVDVNGSFAATGAITAAGVSSSTGFLNVGVSSELTVSSGAITVTMSHHTVDTESDAASDNLDTISGGSHGDILVLHCQNSARTVVVKNGTGNIFCGADISLNNILDTVTLIRTASVWLRLSSANNGA